MIKLRDILMEIGDGSSEPFEYETMESTPTRFRYIISANAHNKKLSIELHGYTLDWWELKSAIPQQDIINMEKVFNLPLTNTDEIESDPYMDKNFKAMYIVFGLNTGFNPIKGLKSDDGDDFQLVNDKVYMFRLMATIKQILMPLLEKRKINLIQYNPAKRDKEKDAVSTDVGRSRLYDIFIRSSFPGAKSINSVSTIRPNVYTLIRPVK